MMSYYEMYYPFPHYDWSRQYPPVDTATFHHSVVAFQKIANESATILSKLAQSPFAHQLMSAAQAGNQREVDRLIKSIGTATPVTTSYTPDGVLLTIHADTQGSQCCRLTMYLRWR
ncbi:hypothetical protein [Ammoniphilus sp. 3BR4]|uniref:hypothetical protein n=1 Tax=Ammoniphilus sp. 3BR4 TaxID=3158265 RepID=UPI00346533E5